MKASLVIFTVLSVLACGQAVEKSLGGRIECFRGVQTRMFEDQIKKLLEDLREQLKEGIPNMGIPPMDPLVLDNVNINLDEPLAKLAGNINARFDGLMGWEITNIKFSLVGMKFSFGFLFPKVSGKGSYKIDGNLAQVLPVFGAGDFDVVAENFNITGSGKLGTKGSGVNQSVVLQNFKIGASLEKLNFDITGVLDDAEMSQLLSQMISESLPELLNTFQSQISDMVSKLMTDLANGALEGITIQDILDMIKPKPKPPQLAQYRIHCGDY